MSDKIHLATFNTYIARTHDGQNVCEPEQRNDDNESLCGLEVTPVVVHGGLRVELGEDNLQKKLCHMIIHFHTH